MIDLPKITKSQYKLILLILKFRYTTSYLTTKYFLHKDNKTAKDWLKDLTDKGYLNIIKKPKDKTSPYVYCLSQKARHLVKNEKTLVKSLSKYFYREKDKSEQFIRINLTLLQVFTRIRNTIKNNDELYFYNKHEIKVFENFPKDVDAYIAIEKKSVTKRYFIEALIENKNNEQRFKYNIRKYFDYFSEGYWQANYDKERLPDLLLITENERRKMHAFYYSLAKFNKSFDNFKIFITSIDQIKYSKDDSNIWLEVK